MASPPSAALGDELLPRHPTLTTLTMADLTAYLVLAVALVPPLLRQSQRLFGSARSASHAPPPPPPPPSSSRFASKARLAPFATPFSAAVTITTLGLVLISLANLVPVQYGVDIFIPVQAVHNLRRSIYTLYTAPSVYRASSHDDVDRPPFHIQALRGGYTPDLFLAYSAPITIPTTTLRSLIDAAPSLLPIGFHTLPKQQELQALIARLSSYEARRIYLLLGPKPLLDCTFCTKPNDFFWYALPFLLAAYAWRILALGLITVHPDDSIAVAIRQAAGLFSRKPRAPPSKSDDADRSKWRTPAVTLLVALVSIEILIMFELGQVTPGSARLNHWHSNLHLVRQLAFLAVVVVIYLFPAPRVPDGFQQTMQHMDATQQNLQSILHLNEITDATRAVVLDDQTLLRRATTERKHSSTDSAAQLIRAVQAQGGDAASDTLAQAQNSIRSVTLQWWRTAEQLNRQLDRGSPSASSSNSAPAHTAAASDPSSNPSAHGTNP